MDIFEGRKKGLKKLFHEIIPESILAKKMTPQAVLRRIMQRVMMLDTMKKL